VEESSQEIVNSAKQKIGFLLLGTIVAISILIYIQFNTSANEISNTADELEVIKPFTNGDPNNIYRLGSFKFSIPNRWTVTNSQGIDFTVYNVVTEDSVTFGIYLGGHPSIPDELKGSMVDRELNKSKESSIPKNKKVELGKFYKVYSENVKAYQRYDYEKEQLIPPKIDSLTVELFTNNRRNIWTLEPPLTIKGDIDIIIEDINSEQREVHLFGEDLDSVLRSKIIEVAKSIR